MRDLCAALFAIQALILGFAPIAGAVTIDFDSLAGGTTVTNQFPAMFSSVAGQEVATVAFAGGTSAPNIICTRAVGGAINCDQDIVVDFTAAVFDLSFLVTGDDDSGITAMVDVYVNSLLDSTVDIVTDSTPFIAQPVDLSAFSDVTRIVIHDITDFDGLGFDDFNFSIPGLPGFWLVGAIASFSAALGLLLGRVRARRRGGSPL